MFEALPLRGHRDNSSDLFSGDGNFSAVVKTLADTDPILKDHLETGSKNAKMTSWNIQNDTVSCIAESERIEIINIWRINIIP